MANEEDEKTDPNLALPTALNSRPLVSKTSRPLSQSSPLPFVAPGNPGQDASAVLTANIRMPELGPLDPLMKDPSITEIMVNDLRNVMVEKKGKLIYSGFGFKTIDELNRLTRSILDITGRILSPEAPYVDTMLPDGSRVNIVGPPVTLHGPCISIRKFPLQSLTIQDLMALGAMNQKIAYFLNACVIGRLNILISGGTGSGKTTLLNALTSLIPKDDRIITIEDIPELVVSHPNSVRLQTKPQTPSSPPVSARDLVANALRMRPDRILVGECRRTEAFDMLQAMNTGHPGSMTTIHANSPRDALSRLETLCMLAGISIPILGIRKQITNALDLIVQVKRFRDGKRRITGVSEVTGMEGETITLQDIFIFETDLGAHQSGEAGAFVTTGIVPTFLDQFHENGVDLPPDYFG